MLTEDELKVAVQDGVKSAERCTRFCTYGSKVENGGYEVFHNSIGPSSTSVERVHATKTLGMSREQLAERIKTWVAGLHTGVKIDLNAALSVDRGPALAGWPWLLAR